MPSEKKEFLKSCIADSLFDLLKKKSIQKITVDEIVSHAGVGRMTYFRNFTNKMEVIVYKLSSTHEEYFASLPTPPTDSTQKTKHILDWIYSIRDTVELVCKQSPLLLYIYIMSGATPPETNTAEDNYKTSFFLTGFFGVILNWNNNHYNETPDEVMDMLKKWAVFD